jgi:hypothetical protein
MIRGKNDEEFFRTVNAIKKHKKDAFLVDFLKSRTTPKGQKIPFEARQMSATKKRFIRALCTVQSDGAIICFPLKADTYSLTNEILGGKDTILAAFTHDRGWRSED